MSTGRPRLSRWARATSAKGVACLGGKHETGRARGKSLGYRELLDYPEGTNPIMQMHGGALRLNRLASVAASPVGEHSR